MSSGARREHPSGEVSNSTLATSLFAPPKTRPMKSQPQAPPQQSSAPTTRNSVFPAATAAPSKAMASSFFAPVAHPQDSARKRSGDSGKHMNSLSSPVATKAKAQQQPFGNGVAPPLAPTSNRTATTVSSSKSTVSALPYSVNAASNAGNNGMHQSLRHSTHSAATSNSNAMQFSFRSRSNESARTSNDSHASNSHTGHAGRSSFALERPGPASSRPSIDLFGPAVKPIGPRDTKAAAASVQTVRQLPPTIAQCARVFAVLSTESLIHLQVLARIWRCDEDTAMNIIEKIASPGIIRFATLASGAVWCVPNGHFALALRYVFKSELHTIQCDILAAYEGRRGFRGWLALQDDGFIVLHVVSLLAEVGRFEEVRKLLLSPKWLEQKMHWHGPSSVVKDFYTALRLDKEFVPTSKLLLQAFRMAEATALVMPNCGSLAAQMLCRTQAVSQLSSGLVDESFRLWWHSQVGKHERKVAQSFNRMRYARPIHSSLHAPKGQPPTPPVHLVTLTATLAQACGATRLVLKGQSSPVVKAMLTEDMTSVVSVSVDGVLRIWDLEVGSCTFSSKPCRPFSHLLLTTKHRAITVERGSSSASVWDLRAHKVTMELAADTAISSILVHPKGTTVLVGSEAGEVRMFSLSTAACELTFPAHAQAVTALDVAWAVSGAFDGPVAASASADGSIRAWSLMADSSDPPIATLLGHSAAVSEVALFARGSRAASASHDGTTMIWDVPSGRRLMALAGDGGRMAALCVEPLRERYILTATDDGGASVWSLASGARVCSLNGLTSYVVKAAFLPRFDDESSAPPDLQGLLLALTALGDGAVAVWDCRSGQCVRRFNGHALEIASLDVSARGRFILTSSADATCRVWDLASHVIEPNVPHVGGVQTIITLGDSDRIASFGEDCSVHVWDGAALHPSTSGLVTSSTAPHPPRFTASSPDGARVITCSANRHVCVWDAESLEVQKTMPAQPGSRVKCAAFSSDCNIMAVVLFDSTVTVWDVTRGEVLWQPQQRGQRDASLGHASGVNACLLSESGDMLVTVSKDNTARLWNVVTRQPLAVLSGHSDSVTAAWLSPNANLLLTASDDGSVRAWSTKRYSNSLVLAHKQPISAVTASADSRHALTCCRTRTAWLWDLKNGSCTSVLRVSFDALILSGTFLPNCSTLATMHDTPTVGVWNVPTGDLVALFACDSPVRHMACNPASVLALGTVSGLVHFLQLPPPARSSTSTRLSTIAHSEPPAPQIVEAVASMHELDKQVIINSQEQALQDLMENGSEIDG